MFRQLSLEVEGAVEILLGGEYRQQSTMAANWQFLTHSRYIPTQNPSSLAAATQDITDMCVQTDIHTQVRTPLNVSVFLPSNL